MEARPAGTANVARTVTKSEERTILISIFFQPVAYAISSNIPSSESIQVSLAHLTPLRCRFDTITMHSMEFKNWVTALVVGVPGLLLMAFAAVVAYKQLKRTKRPEDAENAAAEHIELREIAAVIEGTENSHATSKLSAEMRDGAKHDTEDTQVCSSSLEAPLSAKVEGGQN